MRLRPDAAALARASDIQQLQAESVIRRSSRDRHARSAVHTHATTATSRSITGHGPPHRAQSAASSRSSSGDRKGMRMDMIMGSPHRGHSAATSSSSCRWASSRRDGPCSDASPPPGPRPARRPAAASESDAGAGGARERTGRQVTTSARARGPGGSAHRSCRRARDPRSRRRRACSRRATAPAPSRRARGAGTAGPVRAVGGGWRHVTLARAGQGVGGVRPQRPSRSRGRFVRARARGRGPRTCRTSASTRKTWVHGKM